MSFKDIFKSGYLENVSAVGIPEMAVALLLALGLGLFIFLVYKKTYSGVMYSTSFGVTLIALTMISTLVILAVTSNVVLSLGMVGALSIVRFRTAIKEPLDIAFLFWAIAAGIVLAAGMIPLAVIGSCLIGLVLMLFVNRKTYVRPYILVICAEDHAGEVRALESVKGNVKRMVVKGKSVTKGEVEVNLEVRLKSENTDFVNQVSDLEGVKSCVLVTYNGDYMG
ncbi:MAG: DUF4956 domain-containing protein [Clostridia bacterium]|nr:DUF4956 domain-containing protein [Clostridia bacterium]